MAERSKTKLNTSNFIYSYGGTLRDISNCDHKYVGNAHLTIGVVNVFLIFSDKIEEDEYFTEPRFNDDINEDYFCDLDIKVNIAQQRISRIDKREKFISDKVRNFLEDKDHPFDGEECRSLLTLDKIKDELKESLGIGLIKPFLTYLEYTIHREYNFGFFIEVLGNKNKTRSKDVSSLLYILQSSINFSICPSLKVDIWGEKILGTNDIISLSKDFYFDLGLESNNTILYSKVLNNLYTYNLSKHKVDDYVRKSEQERVKRRRKNKTIKITKWSKFKAKINIRKCLFKEGFIEKFNFYSTIEDLTLPIRIRTTCQSMLFRYSIIILWKVKIQVEH